MKEKSDKLSKEPYSVVRAARSGVWAGYIIHREPQPGGTITVTMVNARRIWFWKGAATLSELAERGTSRPDECKFPVPVGCVEVFEVIEIIRCTPEAKASIEGVPVWTA